MHGVHATINQTAPLSGSRSGLCPFFRPIFLISFTTVDYVILQYGMPFIMMFELTKGSCQSGEEHHVEGHGGGAGIREVFNHAFVDSKEATYPLRGTQKISRWVHWKYLNFTPLSLVALEIGGGTVACPLVSIVVSPLSATQQLHTHGCGRFSLVTTDVED